jgi:hypothetical protein
LIQNQPTWFWFSHRSFPCHSSSCFLHLIQTFHVVNPCLNLQMHFASPHLFLWAFIFNIISSALFVYILPCVFTTFPAGSNFPTYSPESLPQTPAIKCFLSVRHSKQIVVYITLCSCTAPHISNRSYLEILYFLMFLAGKYGLMAKSVAFSPLLLHASCELHLSIVCWNISLLLSNKYV